MASMEVTVVATALPTIVGQLGGLNIYSWVFSAYLVASTTTVPIFGKLSDVIGHRTVFAAAMALFLLGSALCGAAQTMSQLVAFRVIQGLGAGGVLPVAFTMVGLIFNYEQRARMQGLFSGIWGLSAIIGPFLGGFLVDQLSWRWIFFINIVPGVLATSLIWAFWGSHAQAADRRPVRIDYGGAVVLSAAVVALLVGLFELRTPVGWVLLALAAVLFAVLLPIERRAADPMLPLALFRERLYAAASGHAFFTACAMFGSVAFVPLFVQAVLGTSATEAGSTLAPFMVAWVITSVISGRLLLRIGFRTVAVSGMVSLSIGALMMSQIDAGATRLGIITNMAFMGVGMGASMPVFLIAVQAVVPRRELGTATSTLQFFRGIGGAFGVSVMGMVLGVRMAAALRAAGVDPAAVSLNRLVDPIARRAVAGTLDATLRAALADGIRAVFVVAFIAAVLGLVATAMTPAGRLSQLARKSGEDGLQPAPAPSPGAT